jgi:hypothetical protein
LINTIWCIIIFFVGLLMSGMYAGRQAREEEDDGGADSGMGGMAMLKPIKVRIMVLQLFGFSLDHRPWEYPNKLNDHESIPKDDCTPCISVSHPTMRGI